ncbi:MAG TPA: thioesterase family protein [Kouleothrix sp.]|nr:thioesterase family protein [Kouleothrix sp.]
MPETQPAGLAVETIIRARYAETDAMGVVHHASYITWLEEGRTELFRALGLPYLQIEAAGYFVMLTDLHVRYLAAARYDDRVVVRTELAEVRSRQIVFAYALRHADTGAALLTARSEHVLVARATGRPARMPPAMLAIIERALRAP